MDGTKIENSRYWMNLPQREILKDLKCGWTISWTLGRKSKTIGGTVKEQKDEVKKPKHLHAVILTMHNYIISTTNIDPPVDLNSDKYCDSNYFNSKGGNVLYTSVINLLQRIENKNTLIKIYWRYCNFQSCHKHQAYCDCNCDKYEQAKA